MNPPKRSLQEIWRLGCAGEALTEEDFEHFHSLARSRFHTFALSADEAHQRRLWQDTAVADSKHGKAVSFELQKVLP
jgi:hypothetical protein